MNLREAGKSGLRKVREAAMHVIFLSNLVVGATGSVCLWSKLYATAAVKNVNCLSSRLQENLSIAVTASRAKVAIVEAAIIGVPRIVTYRELKKSWIEF